MGSFLYLKFYSVIFTGKTKYLIQKYILVNNLISKFITKYFILSLHYNLFSNEIIFIFYCCFYSSSHRMICIKHILLLTYFFEIKQFLLMYYCADNLLHLRYHNHLFSSNLPRCTKPLKEFDLC